MSLLRGLVAKQVDVQKEVAREIVVLLAAKNEAQSQSAFQARTVTDGIR
jgi:hypothetical protein